MKSRRIRLPTDERSQKLISLGIRLFGKIPYDDLSIDHIAKEAKISKGLLYHYFPTKGDFYVAVVGKISEGFIEETTMSEEVPAHERLYLTLDRYFVHAEKHSQAFLALYRGGTRLDKRVAQLLSRVRKITVKRLADGLKIKTPNPLQENILHASVEFIEASALYWLEHKGAERTKVVEGIYACLIAMMSSLATRKST